MRHVTRKGLMTMAAATGVLAAARGAAQADSGATGAAVGSPGVLSGNTVQAPVHAPVNVCGNTVNVAGLLNPSVGNSCANKSGAPSHGHDRTGGAQADGHTADSPGVGSGNHVEAPVHVPVNVCGNSVNVLAAGNATEGNGCANGGPEKQTPEQPGGPEQPDTPGDDEPDTPATPGDDTPRGNQPDTHTSGRAQADAELAQTGSELPLGLALPAGAGVLLAGAVLYRKSRSAA